MYQNIAYSTSTKMLHIWDDQKGLIKKKYKPYGYKKSAYGKYVALDGNRVDKIDNPTPEMSGLYESDINPETRTLIDMYTDSDEPSAGHRVMCFDIEVDSTDNFSEPEDADNEITAIAVYDYVGDQRYVWILDKFDELESNVIDNCNVVPCSDEHTLLSRFLTVWHEIQPTIVTGWNIDRYDVPYLVNRMIKVLGKKRARSLSPISDIIWLKHRNRYRILGVSCLDYMALYKNFTYTEQSSYALDAIAKHELGEGKVEYDGTLDDLMRDNINKFIEYNMTDVDLVVKLDRKMKLIDLARGICHKGHVMYEDFLFPTRYLDGASLTYLKRLDIVAPNKPKKIQLNIGEYHRIGDTKLFMSETIPNAVPISGRLKIYKTKSSSFVVEYLSYTNNYFLLKEPLPKIIKDSYDIAIDLLGAYVKPPKPGLYPWVYDLDLTSLYPSIIMSLGISPETKITKIQDFDGFKYVKGTGTHYTDEKDGWETAAHLKKYLEENNYSISANGVIYDKSIKGFLPAILEKWFNERVNYKNLRKKYESEGNEEQAEYYDMLQLVTKILLNSFYGALGNSRFRYFDPDNAIATTSSGQQLIKFTADITNRYYNKQLNDKDDYNIYIDTDSVFFSSLPLIEKYYDNFDITDETWMAEKTIEIAHKVQAFINKTYDVYAKKFHNIEEHRFDIKQEYVAKSGLWVAKKRYAQWLINQEGHTISKLDVKGLDVVRSSFPKAFGKFMASILKDILMGTNRTDLDNKISEFRDNIKNQPLDQIMFSVGAKNISVYSQPELFAVPVKGTPVHIKAALNYNDMLKYYKVSTVREIIDGEKIKWAYLKQNPLALSEIALKGYDDPPQILDFVRQYIDYDKVFNSAFENKLDDFYQALGFGNFSINTNLHKFFA